MIRTVLPPSRLLLGLGLLVLAPALAGCASDESAAPAEAAAPEAADGPVFARGSLDGDPAPAPRTAPAEKPTGPAIEVTWEALAHERHLLENSRFRRNGPMPPQRIVLLSESHPRAAVVAAGRAGAEGAHTAVIADADMQGFLRGLRERGFYKYARPAGYGGAAAESSAARGRVTVVQGGEGHSLVSLRGQGRQAATREIPRIYSEAKQAIMVLRNMTPTLSVTHQGSVGRADIR